MPHEEPFTIVPILVWLGFYGFCWLYAAAYNYANVDQLLGLTTPSTLRTLIHLPHIVVIIYTWLICGSWWILQDVYAKTLGPIINMYVYLFTRH